ncbi:hypothetical protein ABW11_21160 [Pluralibacter gergoviae]|uniref:hypothetical protein n=1 Tax=Pluralibacter gergoviae TaxID=61647 RepID=UPI000650915B|nr:hypothetical protein [Pluralibacter gergoviae]KMK23119.1 hypothetical protein ABW11_21160 [Pluralibacter gergoviae]
MPEIFCSADSEWIQEQLQQLPPSLRRKVAHRYTQEYEKAFHAEPVSYKQENAGRHEANTRLRKFVKDHGRALQGYTAEPPLAKTR